jgi:hypothetical protein
MSCLFWVYEMSKEPNEMTRGECRVEPPKYANDPQKPEAFWPLTYSGDWCASYQPAPKAAGDPIEPDLEDATRPWWYDAEVFSVCCMGHGAQVPHALRKHVESGYNARIIDLLNWCAEHPADEAEPQFGIFTALLELHLVGPYRLGAFLDELRQVAAWTLEDLEEYEITDVPPPWWKSDR